MKISYNWLKWYVPEIPTAEKLADVFTLHLCEVESVDTLPDGDTLYDLNILPNRAHDLLGHLGVARELSGQLGIKYVDPTPMYKIPESKPGNLAIEIANPACRRYMGRIVRGVKVGPSPEWVVKHLESIGQKSINNIVDATNIVLWNTGQPTHAFDLKKLAGEKIVIGSAKDGEEFETVGGEKIVAKLKEADMMITDGEKSLAIAGVKGGTNSGISDDTTEIVLEVANFDPTSVRRTARRLGLISDAAKRFENDLTPELAPYVMRELSALILEMCPEAQFEDVVDVYPSPQEVRTLQFSVSDVSKKLGMEVSLTDIEDILKRYAFEYAIDNSQIRITVPAWRLDLTGHHDMVEEIGRIIGYDKVTPTIPKIAFEPKTNDTQARVSAAREKLLADGYSEVMTYTFTKKGKVEVARGAKGKEFLRTNLADGLKDAYELNRLNAPLLGNDETKIFEIGTVFPEKDREEIHIAYADKKGVVEATLEEFTQKISSWIPDQVRDDTVSRDKKFTPWSQYPFISRDVAVWVPVGTNADELIDLCKKEGTALLIREPQLFDQFTKDEKTSLAVRLVFQSHERTLVDANVTGVMENITKALQNKGWTVR